MAEPEKRIQIGAVSASIFANEVETSNGKVVLHSVVLQRTFKDKSGDWKGSANFRVNEIPKAILALEKAYEYLVGTNQA